MNVFNSYEIPIFNWNELHGKTLNILVFQNETGTIVSGMKRIN